MQFLCLVHFEPGAFDGFTPEDHDRLKDATIEHDHQLASSGHLIAARPVLPAEAARTVRVRNKRRKVVDGPFSETKEWLGGFILLEAADEEEAIALVSESPIAEHAVIEVRGLLEQAHSRTGALRPAMRR